MNTYIDPGMIYSQTTLNSATGEAHRDSPENLRKVCQEFEAIMIQTLYKGMRATIQDGGLIEKDTNTEIFEEMMDQEVARKAAMKNELGLAEALFRQLNKKNQS